MRIRLVGPMRAHARSTRGDARGAEDDSDTRGFGEAEIASVSARAFAAGVDSASETGARVATYQGRSRSNRSPKRPPCHAPRLPNTARPIRPSLLPSPWAAPIA